MSEFFDQYPDTMELTTLQSNPSIEVDLSQPSSERASHLQDQQATDDGMKGILTAPEVIERDAIGRTIILDGCTRGSPSHVRNQMDLLYPDEANVKDEGEYLLEPGDWKRNDMFFEYRLKEGEELRLKGNEQFKAGLYSEAAVYYRKGLYYAAFDEAQFNFELQDNHREYVVKTITPLRLNYCLCLLKDEYRSIRRPLPSLEDRYREVIHHCTEVLNLAKQKQEGLAAADQVKALYRRGLARMARGDLDQAEEDLRAAFSADGGRSADVRRALETLRLRQKEDLSRQKALWAGKLASAPAAASTTEAEEDAAAAGEGKGGGAGAGGEGGGNREGKMTREEVEKMLQELEAQEAARSGWGLGWLGKWFGWGRGP